MDYLHIVAIGDPQQNHIDFSEAGLFKPDF